jgi:hypothetical protein
MKEDGKKDSKRERSIVSKQSDVDGDRINRDVRELLAKLDYGASKFTKQLLHRPHSQTWNIGIDLGDKTSPCCFIDAQGA